MNARTPHSTQAAAKPWWREAYVWLLISGPLAVVIAGVATTLIAYRGADTVMSRSAQHEQRGSAQPAMTARNRIGVPVRPD